jgi:hypothetical protein
LLVEDKIATTKVSTWHWHVFHNPRTDVSVVFFPLILMTNWTSSNLFGFTQNLRNSSSYSYTHSLT